MNAGVAEEGAVQFVAKAAGEDTGARMRERRHRRAR
jgi:hypothetical protein